MDHSKFSESYTTRSGRTSNRIFTNLNESSSRLRSQKSTTMVLENEREEARRRQQEETQRQQQEEAVRRQEQENAMQRQQQEAEGQRAEIQRLQQQLTARDAAENNLQAQLQQLQAELEQTRARVNVAQVNLQNHNAQAAQVPPMRDFATEFLTMIGNIQLNNIESKVTEFTDENLKNPLEFLEEVEKFFRVKQIDENRRVHVVSLLLRGKAKNWFELRNNFENYEDFKTQFAEEFYPIPVQVREKYKWLDTRFNPKSDANLQSFYFSQLRKAAFIKPIMSNYEKNHSIIQQLPVSARQALASIDCNQNNLISQTLSNLDSLFTERKRKFENYTAKNDQNTDLQVEVNQIDTHNDYKARSKFNRKNQNRNQNYTPGNRYSNTCQNCQSSHNQPRIIDTSIPPPPLFNQSSQVSNNHLNG